MGLNRANFSVILKGGGTIRYHKEAVGWSARTFDGNGEILTLTGLRGELPGIRI